METITAATLPSILKQSFEKALLSAPCPDFYDSSKTLWEMWLKIEKRTWHRHANLPIKRTKCEKLKEEFLKLYAEIKIEEEKLKEKTGNPTKGWGYFITPPNKHEQTILRGFEGRKGRYVTRFSYRRGRKIQKIFYFK